MKVLYYREPQNGRLGGVNNVARNFCQAIANEVDLTCFPLLDNRSLEYGNRILRITKGFFAGVYDVLHFNWVPTKINGSSLLLEIAKKRALPTILNIHGIVAIEQRRTPMGWGICNDHAFNTYGVLSASKSVDRIVVNSMFMKHLVSEHYRIIPDKITVIPNGINLSRFTNSNIRFELKGDPSVLYVGTFSAIKGTDILIQAVARVRSILPQVKLHLVGYGPSIETENLQKLIDQLHVQDSIVLHGKASSLEVPVYLKSANMCVLPSRFEGFGITFLEALASGTPTIASDIPSFQEIVGHSQSCLFFKSADEFDLAKAIYELTQNKNVGEQISKNASVCVKNFEWMNIAKRYFELYKKLVNDKG